MKRFLHHHLLKSLLIMVGLLFISAASVFAQKTVSGKVVDEAGMTLPGVNVIEKVLPMVQSPISTVIIH